MFKLVLHQINVFDQQNTDFQIMMNTTRKKALFIGLTTVDIQYFVDEYPKPNTKLKADAPLVVAGGPAANAAIAYNYLGGTVDFLTCIGNNSFRELLATDLKHHGVNVIDYFDNKPFQPIVATVITNINNSERTILTHHPDPFKEQIKDDIVDLNEYAFVFTDGFYPELAVPICREARRKGLKVIFDGGSWKPQMTSLLPLVDVAICSSDYYPPGCNTLNEIIAYTKEQGVDYVAISRGEKSIITEHGEVRIEQIEAIDSLGAGDILHGAFCWYFYQNYAFESALHKASEIATYSAKSKGTRSWMKKF